MAVIEEGRLKGSFKGFRNRDTIFEFHNGRKWRQKVYKYAYHYAYMPEARVVERGGIGVVLLGCHVRGVLRREPAARHRLA